MTIKINRRSKIGLGAAAIAVVAAGLPFAGTVSAATLPPLPAAAGATIISPSTVKTSGTTFQLDVPAGAICPGDATVGNRWTTYIVPAATNSSQLTFNGTTGQPQSPVPFVAVPNSFALRTPGGAIVNAQVSLGIGTGLIALPFGGVNLSLGALPIAPGNYKVGIACTLNLSTGLGNETTKFWETPVTVAASAGAGPQNFIWGNPTAQPPVTLTGALASPSAGTLSGSLTIPTLAIPAATVMTVTATPVTVDPVTSVAAPIAGGIVVTGTPAVGPTFSIGGLLNGTSYSVTVAVTNGVGTPVASNALVGIPVSGLIVGTPPPASPTQGQSIIVSGGGFTPGATVTFEFRSTPVVIGTAVADGSGVATATVIIPSNATLGAHSITMSGAGPSGPVFLSSPITVVSAILAPPMEQEVIVTVPVGVITFTQTCGKFGGLTGGPFTAPGTGNVPGFPGGWTAPSATTTGNGYATAQTRVGSTAVVVATCNILMSTPVLVTDSATPALNGAFYTAEGSLNQVTVIDSRDTDFGWKVQGRLLEDFTKPAIPANSTGNPTPVPIPQDTFNGNYLGWLPFKSFTTPTTPEGYTQTVLDGPPVTPGTGAFGNAAANLANTTGMKAAGRLLASATPATNVGGLGRADLDARMAMYIPLSDSDPGTYQATLELTLLPL